MNHHRILLSAWAAVLAVEAQVSAEVHDFPLGKDDRTGEEVTVKLGKTHPFVTWTRTEAEGFKKRLESKDPKYRGTRYGWNHRINGPPVKAAKGDPIASAKVWWVTGDRAAAEKTAEFLLEKARSFKTEDFVKLGCWNAPRALEKSAICFDLIAGGEALSAAEQTEVRAYLQRAMASLKKLDVYYGKYHNIGTAIDQAAWTAALCLEDREMLKELFTRFKETMGRGILPGGYWYEGTAYGSMVRGNTYVICERTARSGLDLALLNCRRKPLSPNWTVKEGFVQAGEVRGTDQIRNLPSSRWGVPSRLRSIVGVSTECRPSPNLKTGLAADLMKCRPSPLVVSPRSKTRSFTVPREPQYQRKNRSSTRATQGAKMCVSSNSPKVPNSTTGPSTSRRHDWGASQHPRQSGGVSAAVAIPLVSNAQNSAESIENLLRVTPSRMPG